jgi:hypothetical protein
MEKELDIQIVLKNMREIIGAQAQEIAILKTQLEIESPATQ